MSANSQNALSKAPLPPRYRRNKTEALLSEEEKRLNHIASEQKRRQNIKLAYDQLTELVPSLSASSLDPASSGSISGSGLVTTSGKGEVQILSKTMDFIQEELQLHERLQSDLASKGISFQFPDFSSTFINKE